jgi:hypothetical protein
MTLETISILKEKIKDKTINDKLTDDLLVLASKAKESGVEYENDYERTMLTKLVKTGVLTTPVLEKTIHYIARYDNEELKKVISSYT